MAPVAPPVPTPIMTHATNPEAKMTTIWQLYQDGNQTVVNLVNDTLMR